MEGHRLSVPLDLLRRLALSSREAAKLLDHAGQWKQAGEAEQAAMEADEVALQEICSDHLDN